MFPLPPLALAGLLAVAALLASKWYRPQRSRSPADRAAGWSPLGWFLLGAMLGPGVGALGRPVLDASLPVVACAIGWVAARAGAEITAKPRGGSLLQLAGALLVPTVLLVTGARLLFPSRVGLDWSALGPAIATLTAALVVVGAIDTRRTALAAFAVSTGSLLMLLLPHIGLADLRHAGRQLGTALGGAALASLLVAWLARFGIRLPAAIAATILGAGIGAVTGIGPVVVCGLTGFALARWSPRHTRLADEFTRNEPVAAAILWTFAGANLAGPLPVVAIAVAALAAWPVGFRLFGRAAPGNATLGLAFAMTFTIVARSEFAGMALGSVVPTAAAAALLCARAFPAFHHPETDRLTSTAHRAEVSV